MSKVEYLELDFKNIEHLVDDNLILLVTATDLETLFTHQNLKPIPKFGKLVKCYSGNITYYFGIFGNYKVVHVQCSMGSVSPTSSLITITDALQNLNSKAVLMVGIAFGIDESKQNIGDVLIAESVIPYESKRVGKEDTIPRGIEIPSSHLLLNRFKNIKNWSYQLSDGSTASMSFTRMMSGEELVDNLEHRESLKKTYPDSKGGEMEGSGVYSGCTAKKIDCILIKGICDFADGDKAKNKQQNQIIAISSALDLCSVLFLSDTAFKDLNIFPYIASDEISQDEINNVLFDFYDQNKEMFYLERNKDQDFNGLLNQFGIWIHGPSGCGKTNLIARNLVKNKLDFIQIDLSPCIGQTPEELIDEILYSLEERIGDITPTKPSNFNECSKKIIGLLEGNFKDKEIIIFIEEIPLNNDSDFKIFAGKLFSLLTSKNLKPGLEQVKFVLSCIHNPTKYINDFQKKIYQQITFLELSYWNEDEINSLLNIIFQGLNINIEQNLIDDLIKRSKGSPRFVKKFFRSALSINKFDIEALNFILDETERELR